DMTTALHGFGTLFKIRTATSPDVYTVVGEQTAIKPPKIKVDTVDASHEQSPNAWREFLAGMIDGGEMSVDLQWLPGGTGEQLMLTGLRQLITCRIVYPDGSTSDYTALMTDFEPDAPMDDKLTATVTLKVSGAVTNSAAVAPANSVLPAMSGTV